jgi:hypothetical protein
MQNEKSDYRPAQSFGGDIMPDLLKRVSVLIMVSLLFSGCGQKRLTQLSETWVDDRYEDKPVSSVLVIGITHEEDVRNAFESKFVRQLKAAGVNAFSSANVIPIPPDQKLEKDAILEVVRKLKNDAVLITHYTGSKEKDIYHRSRHYSTGYYRHYNSMYVHVHRVDYHVTNTAVGLATNLYAVKTEKLIWSGRSQTWNPHSDAQTINEVIKVVITDLKKNNLLP